MGWFENQIEERRAADQELLENAFLKAAGAVLGGRGALRASDERIITKSAVDEVLKYYHCRTPEIPEEINTADEQLDYALRPHGIMRRNVELEEGWYKDAFGPMIAFSKERNMPVAMLPESVHGYSYTDPETGRKERVNAAASKRFSRSAICFYRPLPQKELKIRDLLLFMKECITVSDISVVVAATLAAALVGLALPRIVQVLTGPVVSSGRQSALTGIALTLLGINLSGLLINSVRGLAVSRMNLKISVGVEAAMMMRLMSLPASFFRGYSPGELRSRASSVRQLSSTLTNIVMSTGLTSVVSLIYVTQIFRFASALVVPSVIIVILTVTVSVSATIARVHLTRRLMDSSARESGMSYGLITGVQKIKLAGAEKRSFARWLNMYSEVAELTYDPPMFLKINGAITAAISLAGNIVLYYLAVRSGVDQSGFYAFTTSYGMLMGAFTAVSQIAFSAAQIRPALEMAEPFLAAVPETSGDKEIVTEISGGVELDHVSFRYDESQAYILDDLSLRIRPGEYIAVVGKTGCGKSTLVRLLLGFEKADRGAVYYDGKDIGTLDLPSLRRKIGTVMQDAGLFQGDIYSNIVITQPALTLKDAWEAAEKAGVADDIRAMPMGMHTFVSEGGGGISGGQRQRLMIARAIAPRPKLLIFDEATSALDNKTQRQVSEALDGMGCTRIVIAHRLSTIRHCDRIVVLDGGKIVEDGTYEELMEKKGFFAELVDRQRPDSGSGRREAEKGSR